MKKIVVLGGGTGTSTVLKALVDEAVQLTAIISMADDGGSTGVLREAYGVLPPGDIRQCLLALSKASPETRAMFGYRFNDGPFENHTVGNIILTALEKTTGSFDAAVQTASELLQVQGEVIPVTLDFVRLGLTHSEPSTTVLGEHIIDHLKIEKPYTFFLEPRATINPKAKAAIEHADVIMIGPGSISTSLIPVLLVDGVKEAISTSSAKIMYNTNLAPTPGQTDGYTVDDYTREIEQYLPRPIDFVSHGEELRSKESENKHDVHALGKRLMEIISTL